MIEPYKNFLREFQNWHYRMTPAGLERQDACTILSVLQAINFFSLSLLLPLRLAAAWHVGLFLGVPFAIAYALNRKVRRRLFIRPSYAQSLNDQVPRPKEFPRAYAYLAFTFMLFVASAVVGFNSRP